VTTFEKWALWVSTAAVGISGCVYGWMKYLLSSDDPYAIIHHPWQPFFLKLHLLTAPLLVFAFGPVYTRHIVRRWQSGRAEGRTSGAATLAVLVPMIASGYAVQTLTSESWLYRIAMIHVATGLLYLGGFAAHQLGAASRTREPSEPDA
jgi:hypothetical protein